MAAPSVATTNTGWRMICPSGRPCGACAVGACTAGNSISAITPMASSATTASAR